MSQPELQIGTRCVVHYIHGEDGEVVAAEAVPLYEITSKAGGEESNPQEEIKIDGFIRCSKPNDKKLVFLDPTKDSFLQNAIAQVGGNTQILQNLGNLNFEMKLNAAYLSQIVRQSESTHLGAVSTRYLATSILAQALKDAATLSLKSDESITAEKVSQNKNDLKQFANDLFNGLKLFLDPTQSSLAPHLLPDETKELAHDGLLGESAEQKKLCARDLAFLLVLGLERLISDAQKNGLDSKELLDVAALRTLDQLKAGLEKSFGLDFQVSRLSLNGSFHDVTVPNIRNEQEVRFE